RGSRRPSGEGSHAGSGRLGEGALMRRDPRELADLKDLRRRGGPRWGGKWRVRVEESGEPSGTAAVEAGGGVRRGGRWGARNLGEPRVAGVPPIGNNGGYVDQPRRNTDQFRDRCAAHRMHPSSDLSGA